MNSLRTTLVLAALGSFALPARAQESPSHIRIDGWDGGSSPLRAADMARRIQEAAGQAPAGQQMDPALIKQLLDRLQSNPELLDRLRNDPQRFGDSFKNNPDLARILRGMGENNPELRRQIQERIQGHQPGFTPDVGDRLDEAIKNFRNRTTAADSGGPMAKFPPDAVGTRPSVTPPPVTPPLAGSGGPRPNRPTPSGDSLSPEDRFRSDRFREFVQRMDRWVPKSFKDSDAMKRFTRRLGDVDWGKAARSKVLPEGFGRNIDLSRRLGGTGRFFERSFDRLEGRRLPKMPNISAPNLPNAPNLGAPGAPSASGAGSAFTVLLVLGTVLAGGFLIWKLLIQPAQARKGKPPEWGPGSWPVDPTRVRTREELIKAYDHLALIRGGKPARHWHHLQVANRFGTDDATRRVAAERLSRAYEKARYAPPQEALSEIQLDAARNDLCSLAGVVAP